MTQAQNPDDKDRQVAREFRDLNRRVDRLEYTQVSPQEFRQAFERVYDEIDDLHDEVRQMRSEMKEMRSDLNGKFDLIMRHITGQGNS
ncbi:hypothetical protein [Chamaesiphon sp. VAR_48_metabat_403]|uniref:hypothetical protein n=1 Tax=Chamaesiphon sp. VAR_48_metabat_403 TaxID=2964700 RepID=UPI00286D85A7|nr:hypothetical protein [Chamaesiphon sp. VAR_48_metabat_403]